MKHHYETIIIGGGISGLACARKLQDAQKDFLLVSKELGGRMKYDSKTGINMGAGIVISDNEHILKYVEIKQKKSGYSAKDTLLCGKKCENLLTIALKNLHNIPKILKLLFFVWKLDKHAKRAMRRMPHESLKEILATDAFLAKTYSTPAIEFVKKHNLEEITRKYINPIIASTFYTTYENINTFYYLGNLAPIFSKIYVPDFTQTIEKLTKGFKNKILLGEVLKVEKGKIFKVKTTEATLTSDNIVFAAPEKSLRGAYNLPKPGIQQSVHRFVIKGERKKKYKRRKLIFDPAHHHVLSIAGENDHDIVSAKKESPGLEKYYKSYQIINHIHWTPATIIPNKVIDQNPEENLYIASDYNLSALEYSFLTGLYAANRIIKSGQKTEVKR